MVSLDNKKILILGNPKDPATIETIERLEKLLPGGDEHTMIVAPEEISMKIKSPPHTNVAITPVIVTDMKTFKYPSGKERRRDRRAKERKKRKR
jgi:hypothetical protein